MILIALRGVILPVFFSTMWRNKVKSIQETTTRKWFNFVLLMLVDTAQTSVSEDQELFIEYTGCRKLYTA